MTWVNTGGAISGGGVTNSPYASEAEVQALKTDGLAGGAIQITATGTSTTKSAGDWAKSGPLDASATSVTSTGGSTKTLGTWMAQLDATGTPSATTYLRGDKTWAAVTSGYNTTPEANGAAGDWNGVTGTDDTAAIQAAVNTGKPVYFAARYKLTGTLTLPQGAVLFGRGNRGVGTGDSPQLVQTTMGVPTLLIPAGSNGVVIRDLSVQYNGTALPGGNALEIRGTVTTPTKSIAVDNFLALGAWKGIYLSGNLVVSSNFTKIVVGNSQDAGIHVEGAINGTTPHIANAFSQLVLDGGLASATSIGLRFTGSVESAKVSDAEIINWNKGVSIDSPGAHGTYDAEPSWLRFSNIVVDGNVSNGISITAGQMLAFSNSIVTGTGRGTIGAQGIYTGNVAEIVFLGVQSIQNGNHGWYLDTGTVRARLIGCAGSSNGVVAAGSSGALVLPGVSDFVIQGGSYTQISGITTWTTIRQDYGVTVRPGASDRYIIADNLTSGNNLGGVSDGGTGVNKRVANNY